MDLREMDSVIFIMSLIICSGSGAQKKNAPPKKNTPPPAIFSCFSYVNIWLRLSSLDWYSFVVAVLFFFGLLIVNFYGLQKKKKKKPSDFFRILFQRFLTRQYIATMCRKCLMRCFPSCSFFDQKKKKKKTCVIFFRVIYSIFKPAKFWRMFLSAFRVFFLYCSSSTKQKQAKKKAKEEEK